MMALAPAFGETVIPVRVRLGITLAFTLIVASALPPVTAPVTLPMIGAEVAVGLVLGIGLRLFVIALQVAGTIAAQSTSLAQFFGGAGVDPQPAMSQILVMAGLALAVMSGLHVRLAELLILSYDLVPAGRMPDAGLLADWGAAQVARAFRAGLQPVDAVCHSVGAVFRGPWRDQQGHAATDGRPCRRAGDHLRGAGAAAGLHAPAVAAVA
jgi:flagellar biosynthesis protein FliR